MISKALPIQGDISAWASSRYQAHFPDEVGSGIEAIRLKRRGIGNGSYLDLCPRYAGI